jgi:hypothetical protein
MRTDRSFVKVVSIGAVCLLVFLLALIGGTSSELPTNGSIGDHKAALSSPTNVSSIKRSPSNPACTVPPTAVYPAPVARIPAHSVATIGLTRQVQATQAASPLAKPTAENGSYYGQPNVMGVPKTVHVSGYYCKDGTYVRGHYRSKPKR